LKEHRRLAGLGSDKQRKSGLVWKNIKKAAKIWTGIYSHTVLGVIYYMDKAGNQQAHPCSFKRRWKLFLPAVSEMTRHFIFFIFKSSSYVVIKQPEADSVFSIVKNTKFYIFSGEILLYIFTRENLLSCNFKKQF
jgi:hypothetical protein